MGIKVTSSPKTVNLNFNYYETEGDSLYSIAVGKEYSVGVEVDDVAATITVPVAFSTDLASVPKVPVVYGIFKLLDIVSPVTHDYMYSTHPYTRKKCDKIFYKQLRFNGVSWLKAKVMYWAVRAFGHSSW